MVLLKLFLLLLLLAYAFSIYRAPVKVNRKMPKEFATKQALADYFGHLGKKYKNLDGSTYGIHNWDAVIYTLNITIGSPPQHFNVSLFDNLADTWIPCKNAIYDIYNLTIDNHNLFDCDKSSSCKQVGSNYRFPLINGGIIMSDVLCLGNGEICTDQTQSFGCVTSEDLMLSAVPYDGVLGLGFRTLNFVTKSPFDQFFNNKVKCPQPMYSLWFNPDNQFADGEFTICGVDTNLYQGEIAWNDLLGEDLGFRDNTWAFELDYISVIGYELSGNLYALIDMFAPIIYGPPDQVADLAKAIGATPLLGINITGQYVMQCSMVPSARNITITMSDQNFVLTPDDYILRANVSDNNGEEVCILGIEAIYLPTDYNTVLSNIWVLGDNFMRKFYTVFEKNGTNSRVGFAQPKN